MKQEMNHYTSLGVALVVQLRWTASEDRPAMINHFIDVAFDDSQVDLELVERAMVRLGEILKRRMSF